MHETQPESVQLKIQLEMLVAIGQTVLVAVFESWPTHVYRSLETVITALIYVYSYLIGWPSLYSVEESRLCSWSGVRGLISLGLVLP